MTNKGKLMQQKFITNYIKTNGNGTQAVKLSGYNTKSDKTAGIQSSRLLARASVRRSIKAILNRQGLNKDYLAEKLKDIAEAGTSDKAMQNATVGDALKSLEFIAKLHRLLDKNVNINKKSVKLELKGKTKEDLSKTLNTFRNSFDKYAQVIEADVS